MRLQLPQHVERHVLALHAHLEAHPAHHAKTKAMRRAEASGQQQSKHKMDEQHTRCADQEAKDGHILSGYTSLIMVFAVSLSMQNADMSQAKVSNA